MKDSKNITTVPVRVSYPNVFKAKSVMGGDPTYSITLMFDKKNKEQMGCLKSIKSMCEACLRETWPDEKKRPRIPVIGHDKSPIKDADKNSDGNGVPFVEKNPEYAGHYFLRASMKEEFGPVTVVNRARQEIIKKSEIYGGCFCKININPYAYNGESNKGVTFGLNGVQKWEDGESFGAVKPDVDDMFDADEEFMDEDDGSFGEEEEDILGGKG